MLINDSEQFVKSHFDDEAEIERIVQKYAEQLFGSNIIYLPLGNIGVGVPEIDLGAWKYSGGVESL